MASILESPSCSAGFCHFAEFLGTGAVKTAAPYDYEPYKHIIYKFPIASVHAFVIALAVSVVLGMSIAFDRNGVPVFAGEPQYMEEYEERCWDLYYGRSSNQESRAATAIHLRSGLTGPAYDAVKALKHVDLHTMEEEKATPKGVELLLNRLREAIQVVRPVKVQEIFMSALYATTVWR